MSALLSIPLPLTPAALTRCTVLLGQIDLMDVVGMFQIGIIILVIADHLAPIIIRKVMRKTGDDQTKKENGNTPNQEL